MLTSTTKRIREYSYDRVTWKPLDDGFDELLQTDLKFFWDTVRLSDRQKDILILPKQLRTRLKKVLVKNMGLATLGDLLRRSPVDIEHASGLGTKARTALLEALEDKGLQLGLSTRERTEKTVAMLNREVPFQQFMFDLQTFIHNYFFKSEN